MIPQADRNLALALAVLAAEAGRLILEIAAAGADSRVKGDGSPVTVADERAEALLIEGLAHLLPGVPVLAEELASAGTLPARHDEMLVIDPLDGTKEFIAGRPEYTVNVALVAGGVPVAGAVHAPALGRCWAGARWSPPAPPWSPSTRCASSPTAPAAGRATPSPRRWPV